ncbi:MAG: ATP-binding cassette domain-containing protein, partial [Pseudomonadota bacterium]
MSASVLELHGITKRFGAIEALQNVDLAIAPGEALGLMGDNGAGKSTLCRIIAGGHTATEGTVTVGGE